ncbi:MAG: GTPase, partial [Candidatus Hodarchaeota archaeon]
AQSSKLIPTDPSMFTTLSTQTRRASLSGLRCLITDTVGFIEDLPEILRESFLSTLEEGLAGDLLLLCVDASEPPEEMIRKLRSVLTSIDTLGEASSFRIVVLTKKDLGLQIKPEEVENEFHLPVVAVSAAKNDLKELKEIIKAHREPKRWQIEVEERPETFSLRSFLFDEFAVETESFDEAIYKATFLSWDNILPLTKKASSLGLSPKIRILDD